MSSKFADFLAQNKIDPRRILVASRQLENLRPEDRTIRLKARLARKNPDDVDKKAEKQKARSGRPVTQPAIDAALAGKSLVGPQKTRILKALNRVLEQKKLAAVELRAIF